MFYSHEILTSRKGGVATVWLVATLGSKSNLKKVNRKAILEVDVPATCRIIITPEAPMALRLQSNLLYGVSRVFSQQCGYILSDAQLAQANMRALIQAVKTSELDPNAGKARPDQLVIQDDPAFLPDFALPGLNIDLSALDISTDDSSRRSSILSPHSQRSSLSSHQEADDSMLGLIIPTSDTGGAGDLGGFVLPSDNVSSAHRSDRLARLLQEEDEGFNLDPGFNIDADGNIIEYGTPAQAVAPAELLQLGSGSAVGGNVQPGTLEGLQTRNSERDPMDLGEDILRFDNDDAILPPAEPFPSMRAPSDALRATSEERREQRSSEFAEAPFARRPRAQKELPVDARQELHNADLAQWKAEYLQNMAEAIEVKKHHKAPAFAKKNAAFWVVGAGIGGVGTGIGSTKMKSPLDIFAGDSLMEALTGIKTFTGGLKRGRESEESNDTDSEARRVRMRDDDASQIGRAEQGMLHEDDGAMNISTEEGIELGRHAQSPLEDPSFPWNVSSVHGSRQGSVVRGRGFASSVGGFPTSAGAPSSVPGIGGIRHSSLDRRVSRIPSASPLVGRGSHRYSSLEFPPAGDDEELLEGPQAFASTEVREQFERYGPGAAVDTQTAADSQWVRATLNQEASNFLGFVEAQIAAVPIPAADEEEEDELAGLPERTTSITFEELLPPQQNSKIVASQALYHVLALATKSLVSVKQDPASGPITLSLPTML